MALIKQTFLVNMGIWIVVRIADWNAPQIPECGAKSPLSYMPDAINLLLQSAASTGPPGVDSASHRSCVTFARYPSFKPYKWDADRRDGAADEC